MWKERVEGLEAAERAMNGAMNIQPNLGSDFQASMKVSLDYSGILRFETSLSMVTTFKIISGLK